MKIKRKSDCFDLFSALILAHAQTSRLKTPPEHPNAMNTETPAPLPRHCLRASTPPAPAGHWSHKTEPAAIGTFANLAHDPNQPRYVRTAHRRLLESSLSLLAAMVGSVHTRNVNVNVKA